MRKRIAAGLLVLAALAVTAAPAAAAPGYRIAFARQLMPFGANIFTIRPNGSGERQVPLVYPAEDFGTPLWSLDRRELLITHTLRLDAASNLLPFRPAIVDPDGSHFRLLQSPGAPFDMSCDGGWYRDAARVLCGFGEGPPGSFSIRSSDGGDPVRLTTYPFGPNCNGCDQPTDISPSGKRFVFVRFKDENTDHGTAALFVKRLRGGPEHQITQYGLAVQNEFADARWSPDGRRIISSSTDGRLFTVRPNGTGLAQIPLDTGTQDYNAFEPAWSPDGRQIVFCMFINGQEDVYTASRDGGHLGQITHTPDFENGPDWGREPIHKP